MNQVVTNLAPQASYQLFIGGQWQDSLSGRTMDSLNPATGELLTQVPLANAEDVDAAVNAAEKAFSIWKRTSAVERQDALLKIADLLEAKKTFLLIWKRWKPVSLSVKLPILISRWRSITSAILPVSFAPIVMKR